MTLTSYPYQGVETEWHRPTDTVERLDLEVLTRSEAYVWEVLREIDRQAGEGPRGSRLVSAASDQSRA